MIMARINVIAGTRLAIADTYVADVKAKLSAKRFCPNDPLNQSLNKKL